MAFPLPALSFARKADVSPAGATTTNFLDALYTSWNATTDYRGNSVPTANRWVNAKAGATNAVYALPPAGTSMGLNPAILVQAANPFAGTYASPDSGVNGMLAVGINKNSGAYIDYTAALPMTSGQWSGYWRGGPTAMFNAATIIRSYISEETIFTQIITSAAVQSWFYIGAIASPYNSDTTNNAESDNRLYGMAVSGGTSSVHTAWLSGVTAAAFLNHNTAAGSYHLAVFQPGAAALYAAGRRTLWGTTATAAGLQDSAGYYIGEAPELGRSTASNTNSGARLGVLRGIALAGSVQSGRYLRNGATDLYHYVSMDTGAAADGFMLPAVA